MNNRYRISMLVVFMLLAVFSLTVGMTFDKLTEGQKINGFSVVNLYDNSAGKAMGARFISDKYGFIIDLLQIQTIPQAFFWVKTIPYSDKGEPHTGEHLLLGKGKIGQEVSALEDMSLSSSSAYTSQMSTNYHFNTTAGEETFFKIFDAKLNALLHPDFTDEEIRREVCHIGVSADPATGKLSLDEKGTVYTEMVSAFEKPWYYQYRTISEMLYGPEHPLANVSGGDPAALRTMVPTDLRKFHKEFYHLANMGAIIAMPDNVLLEPFLKNMNGILEHCQTFSDSSATPGIGGYNLPKPQPTAPAGTFKLIIYPGDPKQDRGDMSFTWPADLEFDNSEDVILDLFLETFSGGPTSNLYDYFINSKTRRIDLGATGVGAYSRSDLGHPITFSLDGLDNANVTEKMTDSVRGLIISEVKRVYDFADGSDSLKAFNAKAESRLLQKKRSIEDYLNTPPMFGFRSGIGGAWQPYLRFIENEKGFRKSLTAKPEYDNADRLLSGDKNFWRSYIDHWQLLTVKPYAISATPSTTILERERADKAERLSAYAKGLEQKYGVTDEQSAIAKYKEEFDRNTAEIEKISTPTEMPRFIDNPPLTLDDQLKYETIMLPGSIPMVASTFENMTSSTTGLSLRLDVVPESLLVYVPFLPSILTDIGVVKNGQVIPSDEMRNRLRAEILSLNASLDVGYQSGRVELALAGSGGNQEELKKALGWMEAALYSPYLDTSNLPRILDLLDQTIIGYRNIMKSSEEGWVNGPPLAYRYQSNPLILTADCFLTQAHDLQRLRWLLTNPGDETDRQELTTIIQTLATAGKGTTRDNLTSLLDALEATDKGPSDNIPLVLKAQLVEASPRTKENLTLIVKSLKAVLPDIPDANLAEDWACLCNETRADMMVEPAAAIAQINYVLGLIRNAGNARLYIVSNSADREAVMPLIKKLVGNLNTQTKPVRQTYANSERIIDRLKSREAGLTCPVYVGLINTNTSNGVLVFSAQMAAPYDTSDESVLNCLAGRMYSGGGSHSLFMKTWGAGLAYSNGVHYYERTGRQNYYAERCPDVAETMRFVVDQMKNAENDPKLAEYAVAQAFLGSRAGSTYQSRGAAMADDLADGFPPERLAAFRRKVLAVRQSDGLYEKLRSRMESVNGSVLIGYGAPSSESKNGCFFMIGPEAQFTSLENYIKGTEGPQKVYRLYPRDFWLRM